MTITASAPKPPVSACARAAKSPLASSAPCATASATRRRVEVRREDAAACGAQQLHGELAEDPEPDHADRVAERRGGAAHALQRDRAERHGRRGVELDAVGHADREVDRNVDQLGVIGDARARAGDAVADREPVDFRSRSDDDARRRVAGRQTGGELPADPLEGADEALVLRDLQRALRVLRLLQRAPVERKPRHGDARRLRADADARPLDPDEDAARRRDRRRHLLDGDAAAADQHLLHVFLPKPIDVPAGGSPDAVRRTGCAVAEEASAGEIGPVEVPDLRRGLPRSPRVAARRGPRRRVDAHERPRPDAGCLHAGGE